MNKPYFGPIKFSIFLCLRNNDAKKKGDFYLFYLIVSLQAASSTWFNDDRSFFFFYQRVFNFYVPCLDIELLMWDCNVSKYLNFKKKKFKTCFILRIYKKKRLTCLKISKTKISRKKKSWIQLKIYFRY